MNAVAGTVVYFNSGGILQVLILFPLSPNKTYQVQGTTDGITYNNLFEFTAAPQQQNYSWTVTPAPGALWPRLIQK